MRLWITNVIGSLEGIFVVQVVVVGGLFRFGTQEKNDSEFRSQVSEEWWMRIGGRSPSYLTLLDSFSLVDFPRTRQGS